MDGSCQRGDFYLLVQFVKTAHLLQMIQVFEYITTMSPFSCSFFLYANYDETATRTVTV